MPLKIRSALLCDLVRTEDTGKHILIGVYTGGIAFEALPAVFAGTAWVEFDSPVQDGEIKVEIRTEAPELEKPRLGSATLSIEQEGSVLVLVGIQPIAVSAPGQLRLFMRLKGERWTQVLAKNFELRAPPPGPEAL